MGRLLTSAREQQQQPAHLPLYRVAACWTFSGERQVRLTPPLSGTTSTRYGQEGWVFAGDEEDWFSQKDPKPEKHLLLDSHRYLTSQRRFVNHARGIPLRTEPTASGCSTIATLPFGLPVEILGGTPSILDDQYTWYYIRTNDGLEGWAYAGEPQEKWFMDRIP